MTRDLALEEHVTSARLDTPPPSVVGGAAAADSGAERCEFLPVDYWWPLSRGVETAAWKAEVSS